VLERKLKARWGSEEPLGEFVERSSTASRRPWRPWPGPIEAVQCAGLAHVPGRLDSLPEEIENEAAFHA